MNVYQLSLIHIYHRIRDHSGNYSYGALENGTKLQREAIKHSAAV